MLKLSKKLRSRQQEFKVCEQGEALLAAAGVECLCLCGPGYAQARWKGKMEMIHRLLMTLAGHDIDGMQVDHKNGNRLDNRFCNLRIASLTENRRNRAIGKNNTSGFKGVTLDPKSGRWIARIGRKSTATRRVYLGHFDSKEAAAKAYNAAAIEIWGEFAKLNVCK